MSVLVRRTTRNLMGLLAVLAVILSVNVLPVHAEGGLTVFMDNTAMNTAPEATKVTPGTEYHLKVYNAADTTKPVEDVIYTSSSEKSSVKADGTFLPSKEDAGKTIIVTCKSAALNSEVSVKLYINYVVKEITLNSNELSLTMQEEYKLTTTLSPVEAVNTEIIWSSTDSEVAKVKDGVVTGVKPGECYIKATLKDGSVYAECKVEVKKPIMDITSKTIAKGQSFTLKTKYLPGKIKWETSNSKIAKVEKGKVTAKSAGTVTITASSEKYKVTCTVKVTNPVIVNSDGDGVEGITVTKGFDRKLKIKGSTSKVTWKSSNEKIAVVKDGLVTGKAKGTCTISAKVDGKTIKCKVTVKSNKFETRAKTSSRSFKKGKLHLSTKAVYYENGKLIYKCYVVNTTQYKVQRYNDITISIYAKGKLIAKQTYKNIKLNLNKSRSKAMTFTFKAKNVKNVVDLRTSKITVEYNYGYQYLE